MGAVSVNTFKGEKIVKVQGSRNRIKLIMARIIKAEVLDIENILESKDWPYLWRK